VVLPEILIESETADLPRAFKPVFDMVWNAFGHLKSGNYDAAGKWVGTA
jgi:hypothetical protein